MREYHKWEPDRMNYPTIMNLIDVLIGDEPAQHHENLHEVEVPEHLQQKFTEDDDEEIRQIKDEINTEWKIPVYLINEDDYLRFKKSLKIPKG